MVVLTTIAILLWVSAMSSAHPDQHPECSIDQLEHRRWIVHRVVPRERVATIAYRYDVPPHRLRAWNGLSPKADRLRNGAKLRVYTRRVVEPRERRSYVVKTDDSWQMIAAQHGLNPADVRAMNWPWRNKLKPGTALRLWVDPHVVQWINAYEGIGEPRPGAVGVGPPNDGVLKNGVQIPAGDGYTIRMPNVAYGTTYAVEQLLAALQTFREADAYEGDIKIGAMSTPTGGPLGHHHSHQTGRDVDIRLLRKPGVPRGLPLTPRRIDLLATWALIKALSTVDTTVIFLDYDVQRRVYRVARSAGASLEELGILLQYPHGAKARRGLVRDAQGHEQHMHVRFACGPCEPECVVSSR